MSNIFANRNVKKKDLPDAFCSVWKDFVEYYSAKYPSLKFEKIMGNEVGKFYICVRPLRDAAGTTTLASVKVLDDKRLKFQLTEAIDESVLSTKGKFADALSVLMASPYTQTNMKIMSELNENGPFEGYVLNSAPYEITPDAVKFVLTGSETDKFLKVANSDLDEEEKIGLESICSIDRIVKSVSPITSK
ncbi:hypothetical protein IKQ19_11410 [Candidatus Saccharibacteria bacterium]|nr:hypothetical protein [Candidatus Saccharibacteria bacterium]